MVSSPMQKKARNSFLLGVVITLIICIIIGALFYFLVIAKDKKEEEDLGQKVKAYVLNQNVNAGDIVTSDLLIQKEVYETMIPNNYINMVQFNTMELQDEYGNLLRTDSEGNLYILKENKKYKTITDENAETEVAVEEDKNGFFKKVNNIKQYIGNNVTIYSDSEKDYIVESKILIQEDEQGIFKTKSNGEKEYIQSLNEEVKTNSKGEKYIIEENNIQYKTTGINPNMVLIEEGEEGFYRTELTGKTDKIKFEAVPFISKIDLKANTIITSDMFTKGERLTNDLRYIEYNMLVLPTTVDVGTFIDIRLTLPNGQDLIVISKKEIKSLLGDTVGLELSEAEILMMESAIVEAYIMDASKLYAIQYVEPGIQEAAIKTYTPTTAVQALIEADKNIVAQAKNALVTKFNSDIRAWTDVEKNKYLLEQQENIESGIQEEIENAKAAREAYLSGLTSY